MLLQNTEAQEHCTELSSFETNKRSHILNAKHDPVCVQEYPEYHPHRDCYGGCRDRGVKFLTDPVFSLAGTTWPRPGGRVLENTETPALSLEDLPPIDAILLSHEDHPDNLDELGRQLPNGRHVCTTIDGADKLAPRPGVRGLKPWQAT